MQQENKDVLPTLTVEITHAEAQLLRHTRSQGSKFIYQSLKHVNENALYFRSDELQDADITHSYCVKMLKQVFKKLAKEGPQLRSGAI